MRMTHNQFRSMITIYYMITIFTLGKEKGIAIGKKVLAICSVVSI